MGGYHNVWVHTLSTPKGGGGGGALTQDNTIDANTNSIMLVFACMSTPSAFFYLGVY